MIGIEERLGLLILAAAGTDGHHLAGARRGGAAGEYRAHDFALGQQPLADGGVDILRILGVEFLQHAVECLVCEVVMILLEGLQQDGAAEFDILRALLGADEAADAGARFAGDDKPLPGRRRRLRPRSHDLHLVAVMQLGAQRHMAAIDLGADAGVSDLGVHGIGEIHRRGAARQRDQIALRREAEHLILEHLELGVLEELLGAAEACSRMSSSSRSQRYWRPSTDGAPCL